MTEPRTPDQSIDTAAAANTHKTHTSLPNDEDIGDEGITQSDAGDDSLMAEPASGKKQSESENGLPSQPPPAAAASKRN